MNDPVLVKVTDDYRSLCDEVMRAQEARLTPAPLPVSWMALAYDEPPTLPAIPRPISKGEANPWTLAQLRRLQSLHDMQEWAQDWCDGEGIRPRLMGLIIHPNRELPDGVVKLI